MAESGGAPSRFLWRSPRLELTIRLGNMRRWMMKVRFRKFESTFESWEKLFGDAAQFASRIPPDLLINISHSSDSSTGVVTVWYWGKDELDYD
jgi:hypothetical protein